MDLTKVMAELEEAGTEQTRKILMRHGAREPFFGVKIADLKKIAGSLTRSAEFADKLYSTGNSDAMYLAGLITEPADMSKSMLMKWMAGAYWYMLSDYTVAKAASESRHAGELALEWINSPLEMTASGGWSTYSLILSGTPDTDLDKTEIESLIAVIEKTIHTAPNRTRYSMNNFVISTAAYVEGLLETARAAAEKIGKVDVYMGETSCKVPFAPEYIKKMEQKGRIGKKRL